ncbi:hypothetical protein [Spirabiliibacterium pneumoniae]|nr:hypothetical protein [Spirabiliibacterium pneumoniae]
MNCYAVAVAAGGCCDVLQMSLLNNSHRTATSGQFLQKCGDD